MVSSATPPIPESHAGKTRAIILLVIAQVLGMSVWFSAAAVVPRLVHLHDLSGFQAGLLTSAVSGGFVLGTLISAFTGLADRVEPRRLFAVAALLAAFANLGLLVLPPEGIGVVMSRALVGAASAGIYPVGIRLAASWAQVDRRGRADTGMLVGLLVGALTLGSAMPYLLGPGALQAWESTVKAGSALAASAALFALAAPLGPGYARAARFHPRDALAGWRDPALRLANLGYLGHMWELYAMWAWIGAFFASSFAVAPGGPNAAALADVATFAVIGAGALGCLGAGWAADRLGRCAVTIIAMTISGACAAGMGFLWGQSPTVLIVVGIVWGMAVIADSAQFSAGLIELAPKTLTGTVVTMQTSLGFLLTMLTIQAVPLVRDHLGWSGGFAFLAIGPALGVAAMARLRPLPAAARMAGGRR